MDEILVALDAHGARGDDPGRCTVAAARRHPRVFGRTSAARGLLDDAGDRLTRELHKPYFGLGAIDDPNDGGVSHMRPISAYAAILFAAGFTIEKLLEPRPTEHAVTTYQSFAPYDWARDFPLELMFRARLP